MYGDLNLDRLGVGVKKDPSKVIDKPQYGKEIRVDAVEYDDGNIVISVYHGGGERTTFLRLMASKFGESTGYVKKEVEKPTNTSDVAPDPVQQSINTQYPNKTDFTKHPYPDEADELPF